MIPFVFNERSLMKQITFLLLLVAVAAAETLVSGIILQNEWWSRDKSPYILTNDVVIGPDARLVIEPGVEILVEKPLKLPTGIEQMSRADTFSISMRIHGAFRCMGKPDQPIIFRARYSSKGDEYTHWEGITLKTRRSDEVLIAFTQIHNSSTAIKISRGDPLLRNLLIEKNNVGIRVDNGASPKIVNSLFTDNFLCGLRVDSANPEVYNSIFYKNRNIALWSDRISKLKFKNNGLYGNGDNNFVNCNPELGIPAKENKNGDSTDNMGNIFLDPIFIGTSSDVKIKNHHKKNLIEKSIKKPSESALKKIDQIPHIAEGRRFYLSKFSPYINAGNGAAHFREPDGTLPDLGIWGGPEFLQF